jgi:hypothetical protein
MRQDVPEWAGEESKDATFSGFLAAEFCFCGARCGLLHACIAGVDFVFRFPALGEHCEEWSILTSFSGTGLLRW